MTQAMTKEVMIYNLQVEYAVDKNILENNGELTPVFSIYFGVEDSEGFAEFIHKSMFKLANLTIETQEEDNNNG